MGLFDWLFGKRKKKHGVYVYINNSATPVVFIPYSEDDPSNVRLQPQTSKIVNFPGFEYSDFECNSDNVESMISDATAIHICNKPDEQYYYDVATKTLYLRRKGGGTLKAVYPPKGYSVEQAVLKLAHASKAN